MNTRDKVWTLLLLLALAALVGMTERARGREAAPAPMISSKAPTPDPAPEAMPLPVPDPALPPAAPPQAPRRPTLAAAQGSESEGTVQGQVVAPTGAAAGVSVRIEWMYTKRPEASAQKMLRRGGLRREADGSWWARQTVLTNEGGYFTLEGVPNVEVKVRVGSVAETTRPGGFVTLRTGFSETQSP